MWGVDAAATRGNPFSSPDGVLAALDRTLPLFVADLEGRIVFANEPFRRLARKLPAGGDALGLAEAVAVFRRDGATGERVLPILDDRGRRLRLRLDPLQGADGSLSGAVGVLSPAEATEDTALRQRFATVQARLDDVTRLVSDWIWETDERLRLTAVSARVLELLGYHARELVDQPFAALGRFLGEDRKPAAAPFDLARRAPFRDRLLEACHRDGSVRLFRVSGLPLFDPCSGAFAGFRGTARDVTREIEAQQGALRSQRQLAEAIESITEAFALFDAEDRLILYNSKFQAMLPHTELALGAEFPDLLRAAVAAGDIVVPTEGRASWIEERLALRRQKGSVFEFELGDGRWMKGSDRKTADGSTVGIRTDITEVKRREEALLAAKETAELASRSKSEFLANISHELRTPLNAIIGFSEMMRDEILGPVGNPQYRSYLGDVLDSARHLLDVINDLLDVAKAEAGKLEIIEEEVEVASVVRSAVRLVQERAMRAEVALRSELPDDLPTIWADHRKLKQILLNLLTNAIKFTPPRGAIVVGARLEPAGDLVMSVADTGIGIAEENIAIALAPFGQVDGRLNRKYEGTGLGLPLSRALAELHGGRLTIASTLGKGTTVEVRIPALRVRPGAAA